MQLRWAHVFWGTIMAATLPILVAHISSLVALSTYGFSPVLCLVATFLLVAWRWDWKLQLPYEPVAIVLLLGSTVLIVLSFVPQWQPLAVITCLAVISSFLWCHHDRKHTGNLIGFAWPLLAIAVSFTSIGADHAQHLVQQVTGVSARLLRFADIPYILYDGTLAIAQTRFYVAEQIHSFFAWPSFLAVALICAALRRRSWAVSLLCAVTSYYLCIVFHAGLVFTTAVVYAWGLESALANPIALKFVWGLIVLLLLLSSDRLFEAVLSPIDDEAASHVANPIVVLWNRFWWHPTHANERQRGTKKDWSSIGFIVSLIAVFAMVTGSAVQAAGLPDALSSVRLALERSWSPRPGLFSELKTEQLVIDHREINGMHKDQWGSVADVWTMSATNDQTEFVVTQRPTGMRSVQAMYSAEGWTPQDDTSFDDVLQTPDDQSFKTTLLRGADDEHQALLIVSTASRTGTIHSVEDVEQADSSDIWTVHSFTRFLGQPNEDSIRNGISRFAQQVNILSEHLSSSSKN